MDNEHINELSAEEVAKFVGLMTPEELQGIITRLSLEQTLVALSCVNEEKETNWKKKTLVILGNIPNIRWLEAAGKVISPLQSREMLDYCLQTDKSQQWKLSPLVVGMPK